MSKTRPTLTPDERPEWDALIRDVVNGDYSRTDVTDKTAKVLEHLESADAQGIGWARRALEEAAANGMREFVKAWLKENDTVSYKGFNGQVSALSTRVGVKRRGAHQQVLFHELTRDELAAHLKMLVSQRSGLNDRLTAERRLLKIMEAHPEAATLGEALDAERVTLAEVMAA